MVKGQIDGCVNKKRSRKIITFLVQEIIFNWEQIQV